MKNEKLDAYKAAKAEVMASGKEIIKDLLMEFLRGHDEVLALGWRQYTPYFNDGEPCVFGVHDPEVVLKGTVTHTPGHYESDVFLDEWSLREKRQALSDDLKALAREFNDLEEIMQNAFGDHVRVTVLPDGEVEVEEYDHD